MTIQGLLYGEKIIEGELYFLPKYTGNVLLENT